jgi:hypothetical protein
MDRFLDHIAAQRGKIKKQLAKLQDELDKLDYSERQYRASGAVSSQVASELPLTASVNESAVTRDVISGSVIPGHLKGTIKDRVLAILGKNPEGMTSSQLLNVLQITGLPALARESLSPQLSRLRNADRKIDLNHGVWTLKHESQGA